MKSDQVKQVEFKESQATALHYLKSLTAVARESFLILNIDLRVVSANPTFYKNFQVKPEETENKHLYELGNGQWDIPELKKLLEEILPKKKVVRDYEVTHDFQTIGKKTILLNARQIDTSQIIILAMEDITERKRLEKEMIKQEESRYDTLYRASADAIMTLEPPDWKFASGNPAALKMFKAKDEKTFVTLSPWELSPQKQPDGTESKQLAKEMIEGAVKNGSSYFEWYHKRLNGESFPANVLLSRIDIGKKMFLQATVRDITVYRNKISDLEAINKLMVNRELKMVELKKEIESLKNQLNAGSQK